MTTIFIDTRDTGRKCRQCEKCSVVAPLDFFPNEFVSLCKHCYKKPTPKTDLDHFICYIRGQDYDPILAVKFKWYEIDPSILFAEKKLYRVNVGGVRWGRVKVKEYNKVSLDKE